MYAALIVPANCDGMEGLYLPPLLPMELETEQQPEQEKPLSTAAPPSVHVQGYDLGTHAHILSQI